jgi:hypothetical protein
MPDPQAGSEASMKPHLFRGEEKEYQPPVPAFLTLSRNTELYIEDYNKPVLTTPMHSSFPDPIHHQTLNRASEHSSRKPRLKHNAFISKMSRKNPTEQ